ncbi:MAG: cupin domain-containing protein [Campylobacterota bacterium]|nr:cupin domain-containing protein [Campylobacterota bacterium]
MDKNFFFNFKENIPAKHDNEIFETILSNENIKMERIISYGQTTPKDQWYDQDEDEFVFLISGEAKIKYDDDSIYHLKSGMSLYITAHQKHQVIYTSNPTIWLTLFVKGSKDDK